MGLVYYLNEILGIKSIPRDLLQKEVSSEQAEAILESHQPIQFRTQKSAQNHGAGFANLNQVKENLIFVSVVESNQTVFEANAFSLFEKMVKAMGLRHSDYQLVEFNKYHLREFYEQLLGIENKIIVLMGNEPERMGLQTVAPRNANEQAGVPLQKIETYSPVLLLENSALKKPAWDDLQLVMKACLTI